MLIFLKIKEIIKNKLFKLYRRRYLIRKGLKGTVVNRGHLK